MGRPLDLASAEESGVVGADPANFDTPSLLFCLACLVLLGGWVWPSLQSHQMFCNRPKSYRESARIDGLRVLG